MTSASCRVTVDIPTNKQYSSHRGRQSYQVIIQVIIITKQYCKYYCDAISIALWFNHRMKHITSRGPYLSSRKVLTYPAGPSISEMTLQHLSLFSLWLSPILCFYPACLRQSSYFFSWCGLWWGIFLLCCCCCCCCCCCLFLTIVYSLSFSWNMYDQVRAGAPPAWGRGSP